MSSFVFNTFEKSHMEGKIGPIERSFWQSPLWAEILIKTGQAQLVQAKKGDITVLIERRSIWKHFTGLYILGVDAGILTPELLEDMRKSVVQSSDLFLQIEPLCQHQEPRAKNQEQNAPFRRFIEPVTALLDLTMPEGELLASFAEKGRYNIRLAQKRGVRTKWVKASEAWSEKGQVKSDKGEQNTYIQAFFELLDETTKRDGFAHNSMAYYRHFVETLEKYNAGGLLVAEKDGVLHAAGIFAYWENTAIYYYGASSSDPTIRRDMATYLLQWDAIREGIQRGCETYDFLGISADGKGKLAGVTEFKLRFNPEKKHWPHEQVIVFRPFILLLLQCVSKIRKIFR